MADSSAFADLNGKVVVVFGGAGFVGGAIVLDLLTKGATVAVASRTPESLEKLSQWTSEELTKLGKTGSGKLLTFNRDVSTEASAQAFIEEVKSHEATGGRIDHAVSSLGSWAIDGPILEVSLERFHQQVDNYATSHFIALKALLPIIADQEGSSFTIVTGTVSGAPLPLQMRGFDDCVYRSSRRAAVGAWSRYAYRWRFSSLRPEQRRED